MDTIFYNIKQKINPLNYCNTKIWGKKNGAAQFIVNKIRRDRYRKFRNPTGVPQKRIETSFN